MVLIILFFIGMGASALRIPFKNLFIDISRLLIFRLVKPVGINAQGGPCGGLFLRGRLVRIGGGVLLIRALQLVKAAAVGAVAAEGQGDVALVEVPGDAGEVVAFQDVRQGLPENVAQGGFAVGVQAARDHGAVGQDAQHPPGALADAFVGDVGVLDGGPGELLLPAEEDAPLQQEAAVVLHLFGQAGDPGELLLQNLHHGQGLGVGLPGAGEVPQPQDGELFLLPGGTLGEPGDGADIGLRAGEVQVVIELRLVLSVVEGDAVEGKVHLPEGGFAQKHLLLLVEKGAVGGQVDLEAVFLADVQEKPQQRVHQGLPLDVEVDELGVRGHLPDDVAELDLVHGAPGPGTGGAEGTVEVADVADLDIYSFKAHDRATFDASVSFIVPQFSRKSTFFR